MDLIIKSKHVTIQLLDSKQFQDIITRLERMENLMSTETAAVIKAVDDAANAIAARIQKLIDLAASNGSATEAEIRAALQPEVDKLTALGADPANPVPTP